MSGRPLDVLEASLNETVTVALKDGTAYVGTLSGYDQHMNVVLEAPGEDTDADGLGELTVDSVEDTTIIRGDNVVSITV
ncbi:small nuclear ribonucleoprotein [Halohasta litchfieldiae]|jgi:small nuclear ribonucleoprotein|uniref:Small nuclear ribonucleoprotein, LSM family n=1 Tax=Halohasta litchfieldiae TaxID=1073996 RepID=A0A1H6REP0_9EURY|nr:LSM domain-containing protein [Halohasta litchfieldiae]ATW89684.1 small nuclear ribonucleoprotein [Halohasta litchfieldiae]SEI54299.1 Small nuclear ribonucleoprotein, LSM family [Halohasta litchfieldiae]